MTEHILCAIDLTHAAEGKAQIAIEADIARCKFQGWQGSSFQAHRQRGQLPSRHRGIVQVSVVGRQQIGIGKQVGAQIQKPMADRFPLEPTPLKPNLIVHPHRANQIKFPVNP